MSYQRDSTDWGSYILESSVEAVETASAGGVLSDIVWDITKRRRDDRLGRSSLPFVIPECRYRESSVFIDTGSSIKTFEDDSLEVSAGHSTGHGGSLFLLRQVGDEHFGG